MGCKEVDNLVRRKTGVAHARKDRVVGIRRLRDKKVGRRPGDVGAASEELQARATGAVRDAYSTSELNAVSSARMSTTMIACKQGGKTYKSPKETLCLRAKGRCSSTISSTPTLASKKVFTKTSQWKE